MAGRSKMIVAAVGIVVVALIVAMWIGSRRQQKVLSAQVDRLMRAGATQGTATRSFTQALNAVPAPVSRYLRWALATEKHIQEVRIRQVGILRTDVRNTRWMPFEAEHVVVPPATGFVWNARVGVAPLLHVCVRDRSSRGEGLGWSAFSQHSPSVQMPIRRR